MSVHFPNPIPVDLAALDDQVCRMSGTLRCDFANGRIGERHNTFEHRPSFCVSSRRAVTASLTQPLRRLHRHEPRIRLHRRSVSAALMVQYGMTRVPAETFHLGEWRYSNLDDAIAQARRIAAASGEPR